MAYRDQGPYGQSRQDQGNPYGQQPYGDVERGQGFQMSDMNGRGGDAEHDPNYILNELSALEYDIDKTLGGQIQKVKDAQKQVLLGNERVETVDALNNAIFASMKDLQLRLATIIRNPRSRESRNLPTIQRLKRKIDALTHDFQAADAAYNKESVADIARNLRNANRGLGVEESERLARATVGTPQSYAQAVMMSSRRGESANALRAVEARHEKIQHVLREFEQVLQMAHELNALLLQQETMVTQINEQSEVVHQNVDQANHQLDGAIKSAKAANRKKWYCLGIAALIIIIIIIIVVIVVKVVLNK